VDERGGEGAGEEAGKRYPLAKPRRPEGETRKTVAGCYGPGV